MKVLCAIDIAIFHTNDDVTRLQTCILSGRTCGNLSHQHTGARLHRKSAGQLGGQILYKQTQGSAAHLTKLNQLIHHISGHAGRNGKADTHVTATGCKDSTINTHQFTTQIDQRATGVSGVDGSVSLDEVLIFEAT